jgi:hypothetical protein
MAIKLKPTSSVNERCLGGQSYAALLPMDIVQEIPMISMILRFGREPKLVKKRNERRHRCSAPQSPIDRISSEIDERKATMTKQNTLDDCENSRKSHREMRA